MSTLELLCKHPSIGLITRTNTFGTEFDMVKEFIEFRKSIFSESRNSKLAVLLEPKINGAFPDILFVEYNPLMYKTWEKSRSRLNISDLKILHFLAKNPEQCAERISAILFADLSIVSQSLRKLEKSNLITCTDSKYLVIYNALLGISKIEAVEAKVGKWKQVFSQAILNKNFASASWVIIKARSFLDEKVVSEFYNNGIGLYLYQNMSFIKIHDAAESEITTSHDSLLVNEWIGRYLNP